MHNVQNNSTSTITTDNGSTIIVAADNFPAVPFYLSVCAISGSTTLELIEVTNKAGTTFTVTRAVEGVQTNQAGRTIELRWEAQHYNEIKARVVYHKQTEIDFGSTPVTDATFIITDADITTSSVIEGTIAYVAPIGKDLDELEFDSFELMFAPGTGQCTLYARSLNGLVADKFKVNYSYNIA
jgi:hypothetical protein